MMNADTSVDIGVFVERRRKRLGLSRRELVERLGYANLAKGCRRYEAFLAGDIEQRFLLAHLPSALSASASEFDAVLARSRKWLASRREREAEQTEEEWRRSFVPHGLFDTERTIPSPIFIAALIGPEKLKRFDFPAGANPLTYRSLMKRQLDRRLSENEGRMPAFGRITGFVVNYAFDRAVRFDLEGEPVGTLSRAVRLGEARLSVGRKSATGVFK